MALTEPEAGTDLQNVQLKATLGDDGVWRLNGVKRFITNGCGQVSLVLARTEEGTTDARGLSLFLYERDEHMKIRRLEDKLGIHGSPTCELQFSDAPALLVGERRRGLTTYVMSLMNGARLAIAAQAQGIAEAAYRAADKYADERVQFGGPIRNLTAVAGMLADMKVAVEASRALLYETALIVDLKEGLERRVEQLAVRRARRGERRRAQGAARRAQELQPPRRALHAARQGLLPPRWPTRVTYDSLQVHGGSGYMRDFAVERHARDARITNIYEGTTQLQVVAAIGGVLSGTMAEQLDELRRRRLRGDARAARPRAHGRAERWSAAVAHVRAVDDAEFRDFHAPPAGGDGDRPRLRLPAAARRAARRAQAARGALLRRADERARRRRRPGGHRRQRGLARRPAGARQRLK